jgi:hypothetical protein
MNLILYFVVYFIIVFILECTSKFVNVYNNINQNDHIWSLPIIDALKLYPVDEAVRKNLYIDGVGGVVKIEGLKCSSSKSLCKVSAGTFDPGSCAYCIEPNAKCIHYDTDVQIELENGKFETWEANTSPNLGYCTSLLMKKSSKKQQSPGDSPVDDEVVLKPCNRNTGNRILVKSDPTAMGYTFTCICKEPTLITQTLPLISDCDKPVGCQGGKLTGANWQDAKTYVDIVNDLECSECPPGTVAGRNPVTNHPVCEMISFVNDVSADDAYPTGFKFLNVTDEAIEPQFAEQFLNNGANRRVPDPCSFDIITGTPFMHNECVLDSTLDKKIFFCRTNTDTVATMQYEDDYLKGNGGTWANGCYKFTQNSDNVKAYITEWYNRPRVFNDLNMTFPIVGYYLNKWLVLPEVLKMLNFDRIPTENRENVVIYNAPIPDNIAQLPYPLNYSNLARLEEDTIKRIGLPGLCIGPLSLIIPLLPCILPTERVEIRACSHIGYNQFGAWPRLRYTFAKYTFDIAKLEEMYSTSFISCLWPQDDKRFNVIPNMDVYHNTEGASNTSCLKLNKNGIIEPIWLGNERENVDIYKTRLPSRRR